MLKKDLIKELEGSRYISTSKVGQLCIKLIEGHDENDVNFIEELEKSGCIPNSEIEKLSVKLIEGHDENDLDFSEVLQDEMGYNIIELLVDCYDTLQFIKWLDDNDFDLFNNYRFSDRRYLNDYNSFEDFKKDNEDIFYKDEPDCLFYNPDTGVYVHTW